MLLKISTYTSPVLFSGNFLHRHQWCQPQVDSASTGIKIFWLNATFWRLNQAPLKHYHNHKHCFSPPHCFSTPSLQREGSSGLFAGFTFTPDPPIPLVQPSLPQAQRDCSHTAIIASSCITCRVAFSGGRAGSKKVVCLCGVFFFFKPELHAHKHSNWSNMGFAGEAILQELFI